MPLKIPKMAWVRQEHEQIRQLCTNSNVILVGKSDKTMLSVFSDSFPLCCVVPSKEEVSKRGAKIGIFSTKNISYAVEAASDEIMVLCVADLLKLLAIVDLSFWKRIVLFNCWNPAFFALNEKIRQQKPATRIIGASSCGNDNIPAWCDQVCPLVPSQKVNYGPILIQMEKAILKKRKRKSSDATSEATKVQKGSEEGIPVEGQQPVDAKAFLSGSNMDNLNIYAMYEKLWRLKNPNSTEGEWQRQTQRLHGYSSEILSLFGWWCCLKFISLEFMSLFSYHFPEEAIQVATLMEKEQHIAGSTGKELLNKIVELLKTKRKMRVVLNFDQRMFTRVFYEYLKAHLDFRNVTFICAKRSNDAASWRLPSSELTSTSIILTCGLSFPDAIDVTPATAIVLFNPLRSGIHVFQLRKLQPKVVYCFSPSESDTKTFKALIEDADRRATKTIGQTLEFHDRFRVGLDNSEYCLEIFCQRSNPPIEMTVQVSKRFICEIELVGFVRMKSPLCNTEAKARSLAAFLVCETLKVRGLLDVNVDVLVEKDTTPSRFKFLPTNQPITTANAVGCLTKATGPNTIDMIMIPDRSFVACLKTSSDLLFASEPCPSQDEAVGTAALQAIEYFCASGRVKGLIADQKPVRAIESSEALALVGTNEVIDDRNVMQFLKTHYPFEMAVKKISDSTFVAHLAFSSSVEIKSEPCATKKKAKISAALKAVRYFYDKGQLSKLVKVVDPSKKINPTTNQSQTLFSVSDNQEIGPQNLFKCLGLYRVFDLNVEGTSEATYCIATVQFSPHMVFSSEPNVDKGKAKLEAACKAVQYMKKVVGNSECGGDLVMIKTQQVIGSNNVLQFLGQYRKLEMQVTQNADLTFVATYTLSNELAIQSEPCGSKKKARIAAALKVVRHFYSTGQIKHLVRSAEPESQPPSDNVMEALASYGKYEWNFQTISRTSEYTATLEFSSELRFRGKTCQTKEDAKLSAGWKALKHLHEAGLIKHVVREYQAKNYSEIVSQVKSFFLQPYSLGIRAMEPLQACTVLQEKKLLDQNFQPTFIHRAQGVADAGTVGVPPSDATSLGLKSFQPGVCFVYCFSTDLALGIMTSRPLLWKDFPSFTTRRAKEIETERKISFENYFGATLEQDQIDQLQQYHVKLCTLSCFGVRSVLERTSFAPECDKGYLLVPLNPHKTGIDWTQVSHALEHSLLTPLNEDNPSEDEIIVPNNRHYAIYLSKGMTERTVADEIASRDLTVDSKTYWANVRELLKAPASSTPILGRWYSQNDFTTIETDQQLAHGIQLPGCDQLFRLSLDPESQVKYIRKQRYLITELCSRLSISGPVYLSSLELIPLLYKFESYCQLLHLRQSIGSNLDMKLEELERAVTKPHYERYEVLGDAFLKFESTCALFFTRDQETTEGDLSHNRGRIISNSFLRQLSLEKNLHGLFRHPDLSAPQGFHNFLPTGLTIPEGLMTSSKNIADIYEALIGAFLYNKGEKGCRAFLEWSGYPVVFDRNTPLIDWRFDMDMASLQPPPRSKKGTLEEFQASSLCYTFKNPDLLARTTRSNDFQCLEFIGDAILDYLTVAHAFELYPEWEPVDFYWYKISMVSNESFCQVANEWFDLSHYFPDLCSQKDTADLFEALAALVFIDTGFDLPTVQKIFYPAIYAIRSKEALQAVKDSQVILRGAMKTDDLDCKISNENGTTPEHSISN